MRTINVRVGHDDDAVVTQLGHVEVIVAGGAASLSNTRPQRGDQREDFVAGQQLFVARFFHVQNLAA